MGGPKALLMWEGEPLAIAHARARLGDCGHTVVATREDIARVLRQRDPEISIATSVAPDEQGPAGSLAAAVRAGALTKSSAVIVTPVDLVPTTAGSVATLLASLRFGIDAVCPRFEGRGGHPVVIRTEVLHAFYAKGEPPTLRDVLHELGPRRVHVPVDDADVLADLDTPQAYQARAGRLPSFWP